MYTPFPWRLRREAAPVDEDELGPLIGLAAVTDLLISWAQRPGVDHLSDERLLNDLRDLRGRIEEELASRAAQSSA